MIVFPESLNRVDPSDTEKAIQILESYINYMCERVDHSVNNMTANLATQGNLAPYALEKLEEIKSIVSQMVSEVQSVKGAVTGINTKVEEIEETMITVDNALKDLDQRVKKLEGETPEEGGAN